MVETRALFHIGDAAQEEGDDARALAAFTRGAALGCTDCMSRLAHMLDAGAGTPVDKAAATKLYRYLWRVEQSTLAANNLAILCRERGKYRAMFGWYRRAAEHDDGSAQFEMAKCYLDGIGVRRDANAAMRCLAVAVRSEYITEYEREQAQALIDCLGPRAV